MQLLRGWTQRGFGARDSPPLSETQGLLLGGHLEPEAQGMPGAHQRQGRRQGLGMGMGLGLGMVVALGAGRRQRSRCCLCRSFRHC